MFLVLVAFGTLSVKIWQLEGKIDMMDGTTGGAITSFSGEDEKDLDGEPVMGDADAPVTIIAFGDYECPYCKRFHTQTFSQLKIAYIDTGKVRYVARNFPLSFHQYANQAAAASECALQENRFWEYHDLLYTHQDLSQRNLVALAKNVGIDPIKFEKCLGDPVISQKVLEDIRSGERFGVSGTPAFLINGELVSGAQPFNAIAMIIDSKIAEK